MILINNQYKVTISGDGPFWNNPAVQKPYDVIINPEELHQVDECCDIMSICAECRHGDAKRIALLASRYTNKEHCAVLDGQTLTVIQFDLIVQIDLERGYVLQTVACDNWGGLMEIHPIKEGYIIRGECDIFRYDAEVNQIWQFSGRDILVSQWGEKSFWIDGDRIHCRDCLGWHYVLDLDGRLISEVQEKSPDS